MTDLKPYPEYKNSELAWLGQVPKHWNLRRAKYLMREMDTRSKDKSGTLLSVSQYSGVTKRRSREGSEDPDTRSSSLVGYKVAKPGNLVSNIMLAWNGSLGIAPIEGVVSPAYCVYKICMGEPWFFHHLLRSPAYKAEIKRRSRGVVDSRLRLYTDDFFRIPMLLPNLKEQQDIFRFVHDFDRQVRRFIRNRRRLIEVLNEQKQAIINRAVTRGLDPNAPLKPSGIDWLGDIPEHWEVKSLRQLGRFTKGSGGSREDDVAEGVPCIRYGHLYMYFNFTVSAVRTYVSESRARDYVRIKHGDILFTASGEDMSEIGKSVVNLIEEEVCCGGDVIILRPRIVAHSPFLGYASDAWHARCQKARLGRGTTVKHIYGDQLKKVCIAVPPKVEQVAIAEHIRQATSEATSLIERAQREIDLVREYRTRLISDVVTGKLDVRHLTSPPGGEDLEEMVEALEPLDDEFGETDEEFLAGEVEP